MHSYTVAQYEHGLVVFGTVSLTHLSGITEIADKLGYDFLAPDISGHLRRNQEHHKHDAGPCSIVAVSGESGQTWRDEIDQWAADLDWPDCWLLGRHPGTSSLTMYDVLSPDGLPDGPGFDIRPSTPRDAADFGRCVKFLDEAPNEWRHRLHELINPHPKWGHLVLQWPALEERYRDGRHEDLTKLIQYLLDDHSEADFRPESFLPDTQE